MKVKYDKDEGLGDVYILFLSKSLKNDISLHAFSGEIVL